MLDLSSATEQVVESLFRLANDAGFGDHTGAVVAVVNFEDPRRRIRVQPLTLYLGTSNRKKFCPSR